MKPEILKGSFVPCGTPSPRSLGRSPRGVARRPRSLRG
nr:MAG TPA: hypothetical protein [Caudoviricetes sp.]